VDRYVERALEYLKIKHPLYLDKSTNEEESKVLSLHESHGRPDDLTIVEVNDFIAGLPERDKVIVMGLYQELSQREISKIVGVSQNHVSRLIRRIKDKYNSYQSVGD
jgi:RNA polymerase sigma factor (sigma-70 family)